VTFEVLAKDIKSSNCRSISIKLDMASLVRMIAVRSGKAIGEEVWGDRGKRASWFKFPENCVDGVREIDGGGILIEGNELLSTSLILGLVIDLPLGNAGFNFPFGMYPDKGGEGKCPQSEPGI
jgi:hypothetical protein